MIAVAVVFLVPIYYLSKAKGFNIWLTAVLPGLIAFFGPSLFEVFGEEWGLKAPYLYVGFPALALLLVWGLPAREGAPGMGYLKIAFTCPECGADVSFPRAKEGRAVSCTACEEIITVPTDEHSPESIESVRVKPEVKEGRVCFNTYGHEMTAIQMKSILEDHGIVTEMASGTGGGALAQLSATEGFKLFIDIDDWDKALEVEASCEEADE